jgi:polysaccharide biosynthesis PFTS motif protein
MMVKDMALDKLYYVPSDSLYFIHSARSCPSLYILDRKIEIPRYSHLSNLFEVFVHKITQFFLLAAWPLVLIKGVKKIIPSNTEPKRYQTAIRIYKNGYNFKSEYRTIDFLLDGEKITKDNTIFCVETELDKDFREELARRKYHFVDIPNILRELSWHFIKRVYFAIILPAWLKLCIVSIMEPPFIVFSYRSVLGLYLRWSAFLDRYDMKNFVVYNDCSFSHIIRNMLLSQKDVKTWYYAHSCHTEDLFISPEADKDLKSVCFSYLYYDNFVSWGKKSASYYMKHHNNIGNFINIGCIWSEHIKRIDEANNYSGMLRQIYKKYKQNGANIDKKIIGVFDTSFGGETVLTTHDIKCFLEGILRLAEERNNIIFVVKLKNQWKYIKEDVHEALIYYEKMKRNSKFYFLEDLHDPSMVNAICDLNISACFTSTLNEAIGYRKKAIYFDAANRFTGYYYDRFPNLVAHSYDELVKLVDYWLYEIKDEGFSNYIDMYIKDELDPYTDGRAITRFRELLAK